MLATEAKEAPRIPALFRARGFEPALGLPPVVAGALAPVALPAVGALDDPSAYVRVRKDTFAPAVPQLVSYSAGKQDGQVPVPGNAKRNCRSGNSDEGAYRTRWSGGWT